MEKLRNYKLHNLHSPTNIVAKMIRRLFTYGEDGKCLQYSRTSEGETPLGERSLCLRILLKEILRIQGVLKSSKSGQGQMAVSS